MKTRTEKVNAYYGEDVMLVAPTKEMKNFTCFMASIIQEAKENAYKDGRIYTAKHYGEIAKQFKNIWYNIKKEERRTKK